MHFCNILQPHKFHFVVTIKHWVVLGIKLLSLLYNHIATMHECMLIISYGAYCVMGASLSLVFFHFKES